jgi:AdoMet-dependent heme synthase
MHPSHVNRHPSNLIRQPHYDTNLRPFMVIWETTQACDLACRHCRAEAQPGHNPHALSYDEGRMLIDQIADFGKPSPLVIFTGGDPFKRDDIFDLTRYAADKGLTVALSPSGTPLLNPVNLQKLKDVGCKAISLSLDGSTAEIHDTFRGVPGSYDWTVNGWKTAQSLGLKLQINTTVTRYNLDDLPKTFSLVREIGAMTWSVFFLVPTGRGLAADEISPADYEAVMNFLYDASKYIGLKTTEGHHYKRVVLQRAYLDSRLLPVREYMNLNSTYDRLMEGLREVTAGLAPVQPGDRMRRTPMHINAGDGFVFISLLGEVFPSGYLPVSGGNVRINHLKDIYQESPLFKSLRNKQELKGRCGACEYNHICGGSRSRAYALTGDILAEEPFCAYQPASFPFSNEVLATES